MDITNKITENNPSLKAFAYRLTQNHEDANDLVQETIFLALKNRDKFRGGTNFNAWIKTIMRNTFINNYRRKKRFMKYIGQKITSIFAEKPQAFNNGESAIMMEEIHQIIEQLDKKFSIPFLMYYKGYSYEEISQKLDAPLGTIKSRIFFARKEMKELIRERYANEEGKIMYGEL